jgi:hypothetical protein
MLGEVVPQPVNVGPELHFKPAGFHEVIANGSGRKMTSIAFTFDNEKTWKEALPLVGISPNGATGKALPNDPHQVSISGLKDCPSRLSTSITRCRGELTSESMLIQMVNNGPR